jgi:ribosomal subunit interface protein
VISNVFRQERAGLLFALSIRRRQSMQVTITRKNAGLSESLKSYLEEKLSVLTKHYGKIIDANVVMDNEGKEYSVEITLRVSRRTFFSKDKSINLRAAIDSSVEKLYKQLIKSKEKTRRKGLTPEEAVLRGKVIVPETAEEEMVESDIPLLTFEQEEDTEKPEERTGT